MLLTVCPQVLESKIAQKMNHLKNVNFIGRLTRCLQAYKLPVVIPKAKKVLDNQNCASTAPLKLNGSRVIPRSKEKREPLNLPRKIL